ncbi:MFS transporter [Neobacillus vireti]|uniref:Multidrug resistance protein n=1 Tax=Neobacillus vireti LMG 21834 TaxID=1131730 RepID=A0AB94IUK1_9BACI|nr:MFS transporter [Neobacillus vireti]ETI70730.1 multidrug resistance protein [Neobacillus vireti LMG 21834]KLT18788.1 permease [Neobacillus vireti]
MDDQQKLRKATYHLWTFTISKLISSFGAQVYAFAISFYILQATGSAASFAVNLICNILPRTLAAPFAGYMADKYSRKMIVVIAQIATTMAIGVLLVVSFTSGLSLAAIYTTSCILSLTSMFSGVTFTSSITGLVDKERVQRAMSLNQMSISFAAIASPAVGGLLYGAVSMPVFLIMYMSASITAVILESTMNFKLFANRKKHATGEPKESMWQSIKAGISYLKLQPLLMAIIWISLLINFLFGAFEVGYSFILIEKLKMVSQHFGFTQGAFAVGMLLLSIFFSVRKEVKFPFLVSKRGIIGMGFIMGSIAVPLMVKMTYGWIFSFYVIMMFTLGALVIIVNTPIQVMMQKQIDDDYKGRVFSILETMATALMPLGMVLYGFLYDVFAPQWVLLITAGVFLVVILVLARPSVIRAAHPELERTRSFNYSYKKGSA